MVRNPLTAVEHERGRTLGWILQRARGKRSAAEVAFRAGISLDTLRKIERGAIATPAFFTVAALATVLEIDMNAIPVRETTLRGIPVFRRGKVREMYEAAPGQLLMVASDRVSAFDVVMNELVPGKGEVLNRISAFWFKRTGHIVPNHMISIDVADFPRELQPFEEQLAGRSMLVKRTERVDVECVVRGYLAGSGWAEYRKKGTLADEPLPAGLRESDKLPEPRFTPSTKAEEGHDENISRAQLRDFVGADLAERLEKASIALYEFAEQHARSRGVILADTKFEFGLLDGELVLIDEVLTPDSSRYWPADQYEPGKSQPSFDKQYLRDYLERIGWDKSPPPPALPEDVVRVTSEKYREAMARITGGEA